MEGQGQSEIGQGQSRGGGRDRVWEGWNRGGRTECGRAGTEWSRAGTNIGIPYQCRYEAKVKNPCLLGMFT